MEVLGMALPRTIWFSPKNVWYGGGRGSLLFGSNVYSVRVSEKIAVRATCFVHKGSKRG